MFNRLDRERLASATMRLSCFVMTWFLAATILSDSRMQGQPPKSPPLKVQVVYLGSGGCQPSEVHHKGGNFRLYVVNLSPTRNLQLTLHAATAGAATISNKNLADNDNDWMQTVNLQPGHYLIEATNSAEHRCSVVVE